MSRTEEMQLRLLIKGFIMNKLGINAATSELVDISSRIPEVVRCLNDIMVPSGAYYQRDYFYNSYYDSYRTIKNVVDRTIDGLGGGDRSVAILKWLLLNVTVAASTLPKGSEFWFDYKTPDTEPKPGQENQPQPPPAEPLTTAPPSPQQTGTETGLESQIRILSVETPDGTNIVNEPDPFLDALLDEGEPRPEARVAETLAELIQRHQGVPIVGAPPLRAEDWPEIFGQPPNPTITEAPPGPLNDGSLRDTLEEGYIRMRQQLAEMTPDGAVRIQPAPEAPHEPYDLTQHGILNLIESMAARPEPAGEDPARLPQPGEYTVVIPTPEEAHYIAMNDGLSRVDQGGNGQPEEPAPAPQTGGGPEPAEPRP